MELKEFVTQTLGQIVSGVKDAQADALALGGEVNPHLNTTHTELGKQGFLWAGGRYAQVVHFDVALTVTEGTGTKGGIGVFTGAINLGSAGQSKSENTSVSHVKFSVPLVLPQSK
jgi:hypothetical protein